MNESSINKFKFKPGMIERILVQSIGFSFLSARWKIPSNYLVWEFFMAMLFWLPVAFLSNISEGYTGLHARLKGDDKRHPHRYIGWYIAACAIMAIA